MDKPTLLSVPPELQTAIVSYILRPSDLKSLCLSCQQLGAVATEQLYNDVLLDVGKRTRKPGFFVTNHRGHRHIRSLTVFVAPDGYGTYQFMYCPSANLATRLALQLIPRNILKHFSTELAVQPETITTLVTQQRTMENLALGAIKGDIRELTLNLPQFLPRLKRLFIPCRSGARFDKRSHDPEVRMWGELVRSCRQLKHVALFLASDPDDDDVCSVQDGQEQENQARDMFEGLLRPLNVCDPMKSLDELHLQDLYLGPADCDLTTMVNFESLQWLSINNSFNSVVLVQKLSMTFAKSVPKLRGLIWHDETDYVNVTFNHLQHLLQSFSGLQYLSIVSEQYEGVAMFDLRCLKTHLASLRHLWLWGGYMQDIHQQEDELWTISLTEVQTLARKAQSLCQFALSFPALKMRDFKNGSMEYYNEFIVSQVNRVHVLDMLTGNSGRDRGTPRARDTTRSSVAGCTATGRPAHQDVGGSISQGPRLLG